MSALDKHTSNGEHLIDSVFALDAVSNEASTVSLADGLAGGQGTVPEHDVGFTVLHEAHLASNGLEKRRRPHDAVGQVPSLLLEQALTSALSHTGCLSTH